VRRLAATTALLLLAMCGSAAAQGADCRTALPYPGDGAPRAQIAAWMASGAGAAGLPGELPIMGALVESGMTNAPFGDADSYGYFAMRQSIWNTGAYAGYPQNPDLQLRWFTDHARAARPDGSPQTPESTWGDWVADVVRPPEAMRFRYQLRLGEARDLIAAGCAILPGAGPDPAPQPPAVPATPGTTAPGPAAGGGIAGTTSAPSARPALTATLGALRRALRALLPSAFRRRGAVTVAFRAPAAGTLVATMTSGGRRVARGRRVVARPGTVRVRLALTRAGRRVLAGRRRVRLALGLTFAGVTVRGTQVLRSEDVR
jgi:hypothetical protein